MIPKKTPVAGIGGRPFSFENKSLHTLMKAEGFDPSEPGSDWVLIVTDSHADFFVWNSTIDPTLLALLKQLKLEGAPDQIFHLGDLLGRYVSWGATSGNTAYGLDEMQKAHVLLHHLNELAPTKLILGNHDCHPYETPLGAFMLANCRYFPTTHYALTLGGVKHILLSSTHDGDLTAGELAFLAAELATATPTQEIAIYVHHPSGGRVSDRGVLTGIIDTIPSGMTNKFWMFCGHDHDYGSRCFALPNSTLAQWKIGAAGALRWMHFGPAYCPTVAALAFKDGKLHSTYAWIGLSNQWYTQPEILRTPAPTLPRIFDGLNGQTRLATYEQGKYNNADHILNPVGASTWADNHSWLVYVVNIQLRFPIPSGATKLFIISTGDINVTGLVDFSADGVTWLAQTIPAQDREACILTIPVGLRSNPNLYIRVRNVTAISAWGFIN